MSKKISNILIIEIIVIVAIIIIGFILLKDKNSQDKDTITINPKMTIDKMKDIKGNEESNNKNYNIEEFGISFSYPAYWGDVEKGVFDGSGKSEYFEFSNLKNSQLGGTHKNYFDNEIGRGGALIDYNGFIEGSLLKDYGNNGETTWNNDNYQISSSTVCAYSTRKDWFDGYVYHAICNLNNEKMSGFNFAFGANNELPEISKREFIELVESIKIN